MAFATRSTGVAAVLAVVGALALAAAPHSAPPAAASGATATPSALTTDFYYYTGTQGSYAVPAGISDLTVELGGGGTTPVSNPNHSRAGHFVIDLGTAYAGQTLSYLVGGNGVGSTAAPAGTQNAGGGGTYLAIGNTLLAVAGGGGGTGSDTGAATATTVGGSGGYIAASGTPVAGAAGTAGANPQAVGGGASGGTAGTPGVSSTGAPAGSAGSGPASVVNGVIQPALGGYGAPGAGGGGGGYTGGGGGSTFTAGGTTSNGAGGGGSAYVAPGVTVTSGDTKTFLGGIVFRFTIPFSLSVSPDSVASGGSVTATIAGLERQNAFAIRLDSASGPDLADGRTDTVGGATVAVPIPAGTSLGDHVLFLQESATEGAGGASGVSNPFTVTQPVWRLHDFNGDGNPDVMARNSAGALLMYTGDGTGGWAPPIATRVGSGWNGMTAMIAPGDFNGDGHPDILARDAGGTLWLYPGDGHGGWGARTAVGSGWNVMTSIIAAGDFNGDGHPDVLAVTTDGTLRLYPGNGQGGWGAPSDIGTGWNVMTAILSPGDFDGDGNPDLLARNSAGQLLAYYHTPTGWTGAGVVGYGWNGMTSILSVGDFDGDGITDVVARDSSGTLWLYPTDGQGGWGAPYQIGEGWNGMTWIG